jgi:SRSO17 transposase
MQRFISDVSWDEEHMLWAHHHQVAQDLGDPSGVVMFDESGMVKKGQESAGVARQYCGSIGKVLGCCVLPSVHERYRIGSDLPTSETPGEEGGQWSCQS